MSLTCRTSIGGFLIESTQWRWYEALPIHRTTLLQYQMYGESTENVIGQTSPIMRAKMAVSYRQAPIPKNTTKPRREAPKSPKVACLIFLRVVSVNGSLPKCDFSSLPIMATTGPPRNHHFGRKYQRQQSTEIQYAFYCNFRRLL